MEVRFAGHGNYYLRDHENRRKEVRQLLWGDWLNIRSEDGDWYEVLWGKRKYWIRKDETVAARPLEVAFVDVGQGDGCLVISPDPDDEKILVIDAGQRANMFNFVKWRFGKLKTSFDIHAAVITHPDQDHYRGFQRFFDEPNLTFANVYHNGIAERAGDDPLGEIENGYLIDLKETHADIEALYADPLRRGAKAYPKLIHTALTDGRVRNVAMLSTRHGEEEQGRSWMPGFSPSASPDLTIEVLAPVVELGEDGAARLRTFGKTVGAASFDPGKTKNGHSVLLRLTHRRFTLLFGGDLNRPSEDYILRHYGGLAADAPLADGVNTARQRLRSDVMKSCHHGSSDVTDEFLRAVDPFAFVVSSGDAENHVHPRPDLLGRLGRHGRGDAPLILCTEILRSTREREDEQLLIDLRRLDGEIESCVLAGTDAKALRSERKAIQQQLARRNVEVYGAITLRTDGEYLVVAFRLENAKGGAKDRWHCYWYRDDVNRGFVPLATAGH